MLGAASLLWLVAPLTGVGAATPLPALSGPPRPQDEAPAPPDDDAVREAWSMLLPDEQDEALEWFRLEVSFLDTFQLRCQRWILGAVEDDPGLWPVVAPAAWFDPAEHAPGQPIPRRLLDPDERRVRSMREDVEERRPPRRLRSSWVYDWARGEVRRDTPAGAEEARARSFENALAGFPPDLDLAEALVLARLDGGHERTALGAFAHLYTDRNGRAFPGITLYDAWAAGVEIEMPDVDVLGIVHTVLDDWTSYRAPVPSSKHKKLYARVGDVFRAARRYRGLREAFARAYLIGTPVSPDGYGEAFGRFHALWDVHGSDPGALVEELPVEADDWGAFLEDLAERCRKDEELWRQGVNRQATLEADRARVRGMLVWVLEQLGAFEREERPAPPPPPPTPTPDPPPPVDGGQGGGAGSGAAGPAADTEDAAVEKALKAIRKLRPAARSELEAGLRRAVAETSAKQVRLIASVLGDAGVDAASLPERKPPGPHGRGRGRVRPSSKAWKDLAETIAPKHPPRRLQPDVAYAFESGALERLPREKGEEARLFENALAGFAPDQDLGEAVVLARLDRLGRHRAEARFFAGDYASLKGKFYEGISLFEVWSHEIPVDVPDVDAKAYAEIVHGETGLPPVLKVADRETWYPRMADSLFDLRRHVRIARALAACWFDGRPNLPDGYVQSVDTLHATICIEGRDLERVAARFERLGPNFVESSVGDVNAAGNDGWNAGNARRDSLLAGRDTIRAATLDFLRAEGLLAD